MRDAEVIHDEASGLRGELGGSIDIEIIIRITRGSKSSSGIISRGKIANFAACDKNITMCLGGLVGNEAIRGEFEVRI